MPRLAAELDPLEMATDPETVRAYAELTADFNPIHVDGDYAARTPFGGPIIHGTMALNLALEAAARTLGRPVREVRIRFSAPSPVGERIRATGRLSDPATGTYEIAVETENGVRTLEGALRVDA